MIEEDAGTLVAMESLPERKRFVGLTPGDAALLKQIREPLEQHVDALVALFYEHLHAFEPLRPLLTDAGTVERLKQAQRRYLLSLTSGEYGEEYVADRLRIGRVHERIGLRPQWYLGAYSIYLQQLHPMVMRHFSGHPETGVQACLALTKLMNLDAQIVLDAYFETRQQKALQRAEHLATVGEMAASIAHEVRNPLAGMKGAMDVLRADLIQDPSKIEVVDELVNQIVRLEGLVRDLLSFARPPLLSLKPVALHELLDRVLRLMPESSIAPRVKVVRSYGAGEDPIQADPQQLEQVFLNLIQNSIQAMEKGGRLTVRTNRNAASVDIAFEDTGAGIQPADLERIFLPFFTTRHRGSGLGLAIVRKIVEAHAGVVRVTSRPGHGTTVTLTLPRRTNP